jgi:hypothetical protein
MDPWKEYAAREECRDVVRRWAELEGKSPQMIDHLIRTALKPPSDSLDRSLALVTGLRLTAWIVETWWHWTRR